MPNMNLNKNNNYCFVMIFKKNIFIP